MVLLIPLVSFAQVNLQQQISGQIEAGREKAGIADAVSFQTVVARVIYVVLSTVGIVFIALLAYGGYDLITARGEEEKIKKAISIIRPAIIGLVIILLSYSITYFVAERFQQAVTEGVQVSQ